MACTGIEKAFDFLLKKSNSQGYVSLDDILSCGELFYLEVDDIERLTDVVIENNIIINNHPKVEILAENDVNYKDFSCIYDAIIAAEPRLENFIERVRKIQPADKKEMVRIQYQIFEGHEYARKRAIEGNLRIAVILAYRESIAYNKNIADCISDACFALVSACNSYKPDEHQTFASYISIAVFDYLARTVGVPFFSIPVNIVTLCRKLYKDVKYNRLEKKDALQYVCSSYGLEQHWSNVLYDILHTITLDESVLDCVLENVYSESCYENFETDIENDIERKIVQSLINQSLEECLFDRERNIIEKRFGLNGESVHSLEELGSFLDVSRERIRQIVKKSLTKLKKRKGWFEEKMAFNFKEISQCCDDVNDCGVD
ncbi:sigma-70 family RNA polymerase sigma factor [Candidatus Saccharibacteria bacterium]|nr:sigma-70 family RNA polymerase sigma factor [Candidatus Saccharibacteria bacterium]